MPDSAQTAVSAPRFALGDAASAYDAAVEQARTEDWANRLFARDVSLWTNDQRVAESIANRLGWLDAPAHFAERTAGLEGFGDAVDDEGFTTAVVAGMGGSSLAPDVLLGRSAPSRAIWTCDPRFDRPGVRRRDPRRPRSPSDAMLVASKSGTTTEPNAFMAYAWDRAEKRRSRPSRTTSTSSPGAYFALITDPGKSVEAIPHHDDVREVFLNPPDIGGRYSALTYVGLVPASLIGLDLDPLLASAATMLGRLPRARARRATRASRSAWPSGPSPRRPRQADVPGRRRHRELRRLGSSSSSRRAPASTTSGSCPSISSRSGAVETTATTARSSGSPSRIADDGGRDALAEALEAAGHPVIRIVLTDPIDLGAEFVRWEVATAIAGAVLGIDPFDQPNVEEAKELTRQVLAKVGSGNSEHERSGTRADRGRRWPHPPCRCAAAAHLGRRRRRRGAGAATSHDAAPTATSRFRRSSRRPRRATRRSRASARSSATGRAARQRRATARASCTRPASSTRAAHRSAGSSS